MYSYEVHLILQIQCFEGYVESAAIGLLVGIFSSYEHLNKSINLPPNNTALGSILKHITTFENAHNFQPMNINFGLFKDKQKFNKKISKINKRKHLCLAAIKSINTWSKDLYLKKI